MRQSLTTSLCLFLFVSFLPAQDYKEEFNTLFSKKDTTGLYTLLTKWEKEKSNDPELQIAWFNYYIRKSRSGMLHLENKPGEGENLELISKDTTNKKKAYLYEAEGYNPVILQKGFEHIDKGIAENPTRLDMRFGKVAMYGKLKDYESFTSELVAAIDYSDKCRNNWKWKDGKAPEKPKEFFLSTVHDYCVQLYNTNDDSLLNNMAQIAERVIKYYPDHIQSRSNLAITHLIFKRYDQALVQLLAAEKLDPKDFIVLNNIAYAYREKGDTKNALKYYELVDKHGDEQAKTSAKKEIEALKKKK